MAVRLDINSSDFAQKFRALLDAKREASADVEASVRAIVADVAVRGDDAVKDYTRQFDRCDLDRAGLRVSAGELAAAVKSCSATALEALEFARARIEAYHRRQVPADDRFVDPLGVELGSRWTAIESVGLYVPGGSAAYPSSVLMNAVPAKVAGVPRLVMAVPAPSGELNPLVLAAAKVAGIDEVFRIGGAQAIAALAYGTQTITPVAKSLGRAMPMSPRPSAWCSVRSESTPLPGRRRSSLSPTVTAIPIGSPPTFWRKPSMTPTRKPS
jgi:histidinol dehydrogenase